MGTWYGHGNIRLHQGQHSGTTVPHSDTSGRKWHSLYVQSSSPLKTCYWVTTVVTWLVLQVKQNELLNLNLKINSKIMIFEAEFQLPSYYILAKESECPLSTWQFSSCQVGTGEPKVNMMGSLSSGPSPQNLHKLLWKKVDSGAPQGGVNGLWHNGQVSLDQEKHHRIYASCVWIVQRVPSGREDPSGRAEAKRAKEQEALRELRVTWLAGEAALCPVVYQNHTGIYPKYRCLGCPPFSSLPRIQMNVHR